MLKAHYWKENDILYPMAMRVLGPSDEAAVVEGISAVEARLGADGHRCYSALAARLVEAGEVRDLSYALDRAVLAAMLMVYIFKLPEAAKPFFWITAAFTTASGIQYLYQGTRLLNPPAPREPHEPTLVR